MIYINGSWENIKDFDDAINIIQEYMGEEFSQKVKELHEKNIILVNTDADYKKDELEDTISYLEQRISELTN